MKDNQSKVFKSAFIFSLLLHSIILFPMPNVTRPAALNKDEKLLLKYLILNKQYPKTSLASQHTLKTRQTPIRKKKLRGIPVMQRMAKSKTEEKSTLRNDTKKTEAQNTKVPSEESKKSVTTRKILENKQDALKKDKTYISYYKLINERLQRSVIYPANFANGEVEVSFILSADGNLRHLEVINQTTQVNHSLRETALQIVRNASPFPPFPASLQKQQLTFNVVICFRSNS